MQIIVDDTGVLCQQNRPDNSNKRRSDNVREEVKQTDHVAVDTVFLAGDQKSQDNTDHHVEEYGDQGDLERIH